jgi:hypothetical protein
LCGHDRTLANINSADAGQDVRDKPRNSDALQAGTDAIGNLY